MMIPTEQLSDATVVLRFAGAAIGFVLTARLAVRLAVRRIRRRRRTTRS